MTTDQKQDLIDKFYPIALILGTLALIASGVLFYLGILGAAPLIVIGIVVSPLYIFTAVALILGGIAVTNGRDIDPDRAKIYDVSHKLYCMLTNEKSSMFDNKSQINGSLARLHPTLKGYDTPEKKKQFIKSFRKCLDDQEFENSGEYYRVVQKILARIDPKNSIKNRESLIPKMKMEIINVICQEVVSKFELRTKNYKEIFELREKIKNQVIELLKSQGDGVEEEDAIKGVYNLIDPHCVIFPRNHAEQTLFLPEDLESFLSNEVPTVNDLPTQLYLDTLSKIAGTKLTKPLPINGFFLTGEQASDFTKDFFKSFENGLLTGPTKKKKRNEIETEVVKKLYRDVNAKIKNFLLNSNLIDQVSDDHFDYSKKIELTCKLAIRGLEITDITENSTEEQKQEQLDLTELRLKMLIDDTRSGDLFKCMVWDCMKMIYPRFTHLFEARLSNFKRPKECPEITDSPNLFEQFKVEIVSDTIMPSVASQKTPLSQLVSTPKAIN